MPAAWCGAAHIISRCGEWARARLESRRLLAWGQQDSALLVLGEPAPPDSRWPLPSTAMSSSPAHWPCQAREAVLFGFLRRRCKELSKPLPWTRSIRPRSTIRLVPATGQTGARGRKRAALYQVPAAGNPPTMGGSGPIPGSRHQARLEGRLTMLPRAMPAPECAFRSNGLWSRRGKGAWRALVGRVSGPGPPECTIALC